MAVTAGVNLGVGAADKSPELGRQHDSDMGSSEHVRGLEAD